jgi:hypothetical protein
MASSATGRTKARVNSKGAFFEVAGGAEVPMPDLSDGYRSFLALAVDVLRHLQEAGQGLERHRC